MNCSGSSGSTFASSKFSSTCSSVLMPTNAVDTPGAERTNCIAVCASFGNRTERLPQIFRQAPRYPSLENRSAAITVTPKLAAASSVETC